MNKIKFKHIVAAGVLASVAGIVPACNSDSTQTLPDYQADLSVAVTDFTLKADDNILEDLDSIFFSIDLDEGVIFNADSLPVGTDISRLIPIISYPSTCSAATIHMENGDVRSGDVDYMSNPSDSIDFTGKVTFTLTSGTGGATRTYRLKVNVHKVDPDSLMWYDLASAKLPSRMANPKEQKSAMRDGQVYTFIEEKDGSYTMAVSADPAQASWSKSQPTGVAGVDVRSFTASDDAFYILDNQGALYTSQDGVQWNQTAVNWTTIIGGFGDTVLGIRDDAGTLVHDSYPAQYPNTPVAADFPLTDRSNLGVFTSKWSPTPIAIFVGGKCADGSSCGATWGFDGQVWVKLSQTDASLANDAALVPYYVYRKVSTSWRKTEYAIWLLIGGQVDGTASCTVWMSYDNGVNWTEAPDGMQLPESLPILPYMDALAVDKAFDANLSDAWTRMSKPHRLTVEQEGYNLRWQCPYIYLFGGHTTDGVLSTAIWRGVLNQLTFTPLI